VYGTGGHGSAEIATEYDIGPETVVAAYAEYYIVDGETVFLHSDGSLSDAHAIIYMADISDKCFCD
jgi:hypothetical protein